MSTHNKIIYGNGIGPFGNTFVVLLEDKVCQLSFCNIDDKTSKDSLKQLQILHPTKKMIKNDSKVQELINNIFSKDKRIETAYLSQGSAFQNKVWEELTHIPYGETRSYQDIAKSIGQPSATRAVASAIAKNKIAYIIPCHRVIRSDGQFGQYRWGMELKRKLLIWEAQS